VTEQPFICRIGGAASDWYRDDPYGESDLLRIERIEGGSGQGDGGGDERLREECDRDSPLEVWCEVRRRYFAEHGAGLHPAALGSFLKSVVVMYGRAK